MSHFAKAASLFPLPCRVSLPPCCSSLSPGSVLFVSLLSGQQLLAMTPLLILPQPAAAELQQLFDNMLLQTVQNSSSRRSNNHITQSSGSSGFQVEQGLEDSASVSSAGSWDAREAPAFEYGSAESLDAEVYVYASPDSGSNVGAVDEQQLVLLSAAKGVWDGVVAPLSVDMAYLLGKPASDNGDLTRAEVWQNVVAGAARLGLWQLVLFLVQTLGVADAVVREEQYQGTGKAQQQQQEQPQHQSLQPQQQQEQQQEQVRLEPLQQQQGKGGKAWWDDDDAQKPASSSSTPTMDSKTPGALKGSHISSSMGIGTIAAATAGLTAPTRKELLLKGGYFWPAAVEQEYLAFKQSQLLFSDICVLAFFASLCFAIFFKPSTCAWLPPLLRSEPLLGPLACKIYMTAVTVLPCVALVLSRFARLGLRGEVREWCAVVCAWNAAAVTVPLALGWIVPSLEIVAKLARSTFMMEAASLLSNGIIRPCTLQVRAWGLMNKCCAAFLK